MSDGSTSLIGPEAHPAPPPARRFRSVLGWTVLGAVLPGTALLAAGRRKLGAVTLVVFLVLVAGAVWLFTTGQQTVVRSVVDTHRLLWIVGGTALVALLWIAVIVTGYRLLAPVGTSRGRHLLGAFVVLLLVAAVVAPAVEVGRLAMTTRSLIAGVFHDGKSATVVDKPDPFGGKQRVNVLLLGGDGGTGREGVRTDTVIVASIDTHTGDTTLISLPRNLENLPFPPGSALAKAYPNGFESTSEDEGLLNAVYRNGPAAHPNILGPTDNPGADFLKLGVGEAIGLHIDYYVLVNLAGFAKLVDTLGGITVNVNYYVPVGGEPTLGQLPDDYIAPGPNKHMDGPTALAWARGRFGLTDYLRMARQRCAIQAIVKAADPVTLLAQYQQLAATTKDTVSTDIPSSALDDFVGLGFKVKDASIRSLVFDTSLINPAYPNYDKIRSLVAAALASPATSAASSSAPSSSAASSTSAAPSASATPSGAPPTTNPVANVKDACAYNPKEAAAALAAGEPPTKTHP